MGMTIRVTSVLCVRCGALLKETLLQGDPLTQLSLSGGRCPTCGSDRFRATVIRTMSGYEEPPSASEYMLSTDYLLNAALGTHGPYGHHFKSDDVFELPELTAEDLFTHLSRAPTAVSNWITTIRKEEAKAHLRPDQGLCSVCGDIYTVELAGYTREGYCSPLCRKKGGGASGNPAGVTDAPGKAVPCAKCGQPIRPTQGAKCMHCGALMQSSSDR
jgi:hypothetical protein